MLPKDFGQRREVAESISSSWFSILKLPIVTLGRNCTSPNVGSAESAFRKILGPKDVSVRLGSGRRARGSHFENLNRTDAGLHVPPHPRVFEDKRHLQLEHANRELQVPIL